MTVLDIPTDRNALSEGHAQLVLREGGVTHIIQRPKEDVEQRLWQEVAADRGMSVAELPAAADCPMPDSNEGLVPAEKFYSDA